MKPEFTEATQNVASSDEHPSAPSNTTISSDTTAMREFLGRERFGPLGDRLRRRTVRSLAVVRPCFKTDARERHQSEFGNHRYAVMRDT